MSLDNILGQLLGNGMAGQSRSRLEHVLGPRGLGGGGSGGLGQILGGLLGGSGGAMGSGGGLGSGGLPGSGGGTGSGGLFGASGGSGGGLGDLASRAGGFLGGQQAGGMTGGQLGGLGALAGALFGGGGGAARGALGGSAMAVLGAMALKALQSRSQAADPAGTGSGQAEAPEFTEKDVESLVTPQAQALLVRAMISAAKADGQIDQTELDRIMGKIGTDGVTDEERREIADELARPLDLQGLVAAVPDEKAAAQVYGASLLSIDADTEAEKNYLRQLAQGLGLEADVVRRLHEMSGTPRV